ncbi:cytochrome oxidase complex assembly protein 1-domain-containing protein [Mycena galericulata]|nr:cytochrome oxidase complex assembly protein 1-domain-containing protein [Mycena galericulata]
MTTTKLFQMRANCLSRSRVFVRAYTAKTHQQHASEEPTVETFSAPSRPKPYFRPPPRALPLHRSMWPMGLAVATLGVGCWAAFFLYSTNEIKATSSVVKHILRIAAMDSHLVRVLGDDVRPQPEWWLNGRPWIRGELHQLQGSIDLSMRLSGSLGAGTLYFTSIRKSQSSPYEILRFTVIADDGTVVEVDPSADA